MSLDRQSLLKSISPRIAGKAIQAFDRATTVVVSSCWIAAVVMMLFAIYTLSLSASAKRSATEALSSEPVLPKMDRNGVTGHDAQVMVDRLQHRYPEISFSSRGNGIMITATDGAKFRQWLTALSYVDTIAPDFHWTLLEFCVGHCGGNELMRAILTGEKISFSAPQIDVKK